MLLWPYQLHWAILHRTRKAVCSKATAVAPPKLSAWCWLLCVWLVNPEVGPGGLDAHLLMRASDLMGACRWPGAAFLGGHVQGPCMRHIILHGVVCRCTLCIGYKQYCFRGKSSTPEAVLLIVYSGPSSPPPPRLCKQALMSVINIFCLLNKPDLHQPNRSLHGSSRLVTQ